jgi:hypothetical protein
MHSSDKTNYFCSEDIKMIRLEGTTITYSCNTISEKKRYLTQADH